MSEPATHTCATCGMQWQALPGERAVIHKWCTPECADEWHTENPGHDPSWITMDHLVERVTGVRSPSQPSRKLRWS